MPMDERLPRKLAAILYADVAGYSRLNVRSNMKWRKWPLEYVN